ncbi:MAG: uracil-DNA glycosylase [Acidobacteria bacterium]|nr:uracil-DNA glycosylase [Acidobacteriota bacterium]
MANSTQLAQLNDRIIDCRKCPRLVRYRESVARTKRRSFRDETYWGRPIPGFGDPRAELLILGLAPAAHGGNRTGRVFTGDRSGDFLFRALYRAGFASQPGSTHRDDGLQLKNAYIVAAIRCAPPENQPLPAEIRNCRPYLEAELELLCPRAVLALGKIALDSYLSMLVARGRIPSRAPYKFGHGASWKLPGALPRLFAAYHPSQQNTLTGRLTPAMFLGVLRQVRRCLSSGERA